MASAGGGDHNFPPAENGHVVEHSSPEPPPPPLPEDRAGSAPSRNELEDDEALLRRRLVLSRAEVLRRRSLRARRLVRTLGDWYWALMEDLRVRYRDYYWRYGRSPLEEGDGGLGLGIEWEESGGGSRGCSFPGCKTKAMALSDYCSQHILSDPKQTLYKPCSYVVKSIPLGPVTCAKPVLCSVSPLLCHTHSQKEQKRISQALKKAGLNVPSSSKLAPKFHVIVAEYVHQIQAKRRSAQRRLQDNGKVTNVGRSV